MFLAGGRFSLRRTLDCLACRRCRWCRRRRFQALCKTYFHEFQYRREFAHVQVALVRRTKPSPLQEVVVLWHIPEIPLAANQAHRSLLRHAEVRREPGSQLLFIDSSCLRIIHVFEEFLRGGRPWAEGILDGVERLSALVVGAVRLAPGRHNASTSAADEMLARTLVLCMVIPEGKTVATKRLAALLAVARCHGQDSGRHDEFVQYRPMTSSQSFCCDGGK